MFALLHFVRHMLNRLLRAFVRTLSFQFRNIAELAAKKS